MNHSNTNCDFENLSLSELDNIYDMFDKKKNQTGNVYKVSTCCYSSNRGIHSRKDIVFLSRKSKSKHNLLVEEADACDPTWAFSKITNLNDLPDGIYSLETCNEHRDFETGYIDDYDFKLVPYEE